MFGYGYKEDALKWREHKLQEDEKFKRGYATCEVTVHMIGGDKKTWVKKVYNRFVDGWHMSDDFRLINNPEKRYGKDLIKDEIRRNAIDFAKDGVTINNTHYMPKTILRVEMGGIVEFEE